MEQYENLVKEANRSFITADHLTYVTYSLLKDRKLMLSIIQNLYNSSMSCVAALLYYEKLYKRIDILPLSAESRIEIFEIAISKRFNVSSGVVNVIKELKFILDGHKKSQVEFARKDSYVICSADYSEMSVIDINKIKNYIIIIKELLGTVNKLKC